MLAGWSAIEIMGEMGRWDVPFSRISALALPSLLFSRATTKPVDCYSMYLRRHGRGYLVWCPEPLHFKCLSPLARLAYSGSHQDSRDYFLKVSVCYLLVPPVVGSEPFQTPLLSFVALVLQSQQPAPVSLPGPASPPLLSSVALVLHGAS